MTKSWVSLGQILTVKNVKHCMVRIDYFYIYIYIYICMIILIIYIHIIYSNIHVYCI